MPSARAYARIALAATLLALVVVVLGAYVRLSHAGLSCPDWPGCYGRLVVPGSHADITAANEAFPERPVDVARAWKEMAHRYLAGVLGLSIAVLAVLAWRRRRMPGQLLGVPFGLVALVLFQALLGMWTVTLLLKPIIVTAHLLGGLTTAALLWWLALRQGGWLAARPARPGAVEIAGVRRLAVVALLVVYVQIALGGWTSANYAALACPDFPTCQGEWLPALDLREALTPWRGLGRSYEGGVLATEARVTVHVLHRLGALATVLVVGLLALVMARSGRPETVRAGLVLGAVVIAQAALGVGNVVLGLPLPVAVAHNAGAATLLLAVVTVYHMHRPGPAVL